MDGRDEEGSQEENPPRGVAAYSSILPSMPSGDGDSQDLQPVAPQAVRLPQILMPGDSAYEQFGSSARPILPSSLPMGHPSYSDPTTRSGTYSTLSPFDASMATVMPSAGGILPSTSHIGHSAYSPSPPTTGPGTYATLPPFPPFNASSATVMSAGPSFPGYGPYQSPEYNYGSGSQGYSYDANSAMPHASFGGMSGYHTAYPPPQAPGGVGYGGMGSYSAYGAQSYSYRGGGEYPKDYENQPTQGTYGVPRRGRGHQLGPPRSFAKNPGRPIVNSDNRENPGGVTLFVFYIPNDMTNHDLYELFRVHGNILSVSIKTEDDTGRGKGFGFVSFESAESAASAIKHLNGFQVSRRAHKPLCQHVQILILNVTLLLFSDTWQTTESGLQKKQKRGEKFARLLSA